MFLRDEEKKKLAQNPTTSSPITKKNTSFKQIPENDFNFYFSKNKIEGKQIQKA